MSQHKWASCMLTLAVAAGTAWAQEHDHSKMASEKMGAAQTTAGKMGAAQTGDGKMDHYAHRFEDAQQYAKQFDDPARDAWQMPDRVIAAMKLKPGQSVADIGAGTGYFATRLAKAVPQLKVYGVDIEPNMVDYIRTRAQKEGLANVTPVLGTADSANLPAPVDLALIVDTFHHIPNRLAYFKKLAASLKPGGRIAIIDFKPESEMGPPKEFRFTAAQIRKELSNAGFRPTEELQFLPMQNFLIFAKR